MIAENKEKYISDVVVDTYEELSELKKRKSSPDSLLFIYLKSSKH